MSNEDRNFRYGYYEKVGFDGIDEKKSLDILLRENPSDLLSRLAQLTSRYSLSPIQRKQIWQLLLDIIKPPYNNNSNRINEIRCKLWRKLFNDMINALIVMGFINDDINDDNENNDDDDKNNTTIQEYSRQIVLLYLFETKQLPPLLLKNNFIHQLQKTDKQDLLLLSEVFIKEFFYPNLSSSSSSSSSSSYHFEDTYWLYKHFISIINLNLGTLIETYEKFINYLSNEDNTLHDHLVKNGIIKQIDDDCDNNINDDDGDLNLLNSLNDNQQLINNNNYNNSTTKLRQQHITTSTTTTTTINPLICYRQNLLIQRKKMQTFRPIITWFIRFFAGIIHQNFVIRVLDKVIGCLINGSKPFYVLISMSKALIYYQRKQLLLLNNFEQLQNQLMTPLSMKDSEKIFFKALNQ